MLNLFARHGRFDLRAECRGDTQVDYHHTVEDMGIALGRAFAAALGDMRGITRYGSMILPMDEVLMICAVDLSGRSALGYQVQASAGLWEAEEGLRGAVRAHAGQKAPGQPREPLCRHAAHISRLS